MPEATDAATRKAEELGVNLEDVKGTGANDAITVDDVTKAAERQRQAQVTDAQMQQDTELTAQTLREEPKKTVMLSPADAASGTSLSDVTVNVNGHTYQIKRGVEVEVPQTVYNVLVDARAAVDAEGRPLRPELF